MFLPSSTYEALSNSTAPSGYQALNDSTQVYVRIDSIDLGSFQASNKATLKACVGSRKSFLPFSFEFHKNERIDHTWSFNFKNANRSSVVIAIFKRRYFGGDHEVGEIEIKMNAFELNTITTHDYVLQSPNPNAVPARVRVSIHVCDNGAPAFCAPETSKIAENFQIHHATTYLAK